MVEAAAPVVEVDLGHPLAADSSIGAEDELDELTLQLTALGLPSSFVARNERENNVLKVRRRRWKPKRTAVFYEASEGGESVVVQGGADGSEVDAGEPDVDGGEPAAALSEDAAGDSRSVWLPIWSEEYQQYYFYNNQTQDSTWDVPEGFGEYAPAPAGDDAAAAAGGVIEETKSVTATNVSTTFEFGSGSSQEIEASQIVVNSQKRVVITQELRDAGISNPEIYKYWQQRYTLFSRFDCGIRMDEEGWFSVTPEVIARHQALRCASPVVVDAFAGVGGNAIQFALTCQHVIAIDKDPQRIELAKHNAEIYGVAERIEFVVGDFFGLAPTLKADVIFLSPPWGGPDYQKAATYDPSMLQPKDGATLLNIAQEVAPSIALFLPRNADMDQFVGLAKTFTPRRPIEIEKNILNKKLKAITVYYGKFNSAKS